MAVNIVSETIRQVGPAAVDAIASALGISGETARKAISAAVPALLAALIGKVSSPAGAREVYDAVRDADPDIFGRVSSALAGKKHDNFVETGTGILSSLLGGSTVSGLVGALAKHTGLSQENSSSIMGIASQLALGALAKSQRASGLDASGLAGLLRSQQDNVRSAIPAGLAGLLSDAGVTAKGFMEHAGTTAAQASRGTSTSARRAASAATSGTNWLLWLIPLLVIAGAIWYFTSRDEPVTTTTTTPPAETTTTTPPAETTTTTPPAETTTTTTTETTPTTPPASTTDTTTTTPPASTTDTTTTTPPATPTDIMIDGVDVGKQVTGAIDGLKGALAGITDAASAQAALPKLQETTTVLDGVSGMLPKFAPEQKSALAALISAALPALKEEANRVLAIAGVSDVAKPAVDGVITKLEALANPA